MKKHCALLFLFFTIILNTTASNKIYQWNLHSYHVFKTNKLEKSSSVYIVNSINNLPHSFNKVKSFDLFPLDCVNEFGRIKAVNKKSLFLLYSLENSEISKVLFYPARVIVVDSDKESFTPITKYLDLVNDSNYTFKDTTRKEIETTAVIKFKTKPVGVNDVRVLNVEEARNTSSITLNILSNDDLSGKLPVTFETLKRPTNVKDLVVNLKTGDITFILPDNRIIPNTYTYIYRLKSKEGVYSEPIKATLEVTFSPSITLNKTPVFNDINNDGLAQANETITYTFPVKNTGNVDIENAMVSDIKIGLMAPVIPNLLKPGEIGLIDILPDKYIITPADILAGRVSNTATTSAFEPITNTIIRDTSSAVLIFPILKILLVKSNQIIDVNGNCVIDAGDKIRYTFTVTNKGTVNVNSIVVSDTLINLVNQAISPSTLAPGKSGTLTAANTYTITQDDIVKGFVFNKAVAEGKNIQNTLVTAEAENTLTTGVTAPSCIINPDIKNPKMFLLKKAKFNDTNKDGFAQVGETITYTFTVTNTGNLNISNITITDPMLGMVKVPIVPSNLAPSKTGTYSITYVLTQTNIDSGKLSNTATASGLDPSNNPVTAVSGNNNTNTQPTVIEFIKKPKINLVKSSVLIDLNNNGFSDIGDRIDYTFTITNTGNVTIKNINITDNFATVTGGPIVTIAPNAIDNTTFKANYIITQADVDKGFMSNTAIATGYDPNMLPVSDTSGTSNDNNSSTITPIAQKGKISLIKKVINKGTGVNGIFILDDIINYEFTITNTGNLTLKNLLLTDPLFLNPNIELLSTILLPNVSTSVIANYRVTVANISNRVIINQALVTSIDPKNVTVQDYSGTTANTDDKTITSLYDGFFIPNVFTPNGDKINDTFEIVGLQNYTNVAVEIFNRWGNQVYKNLNYENQWLADGLNEGTYYYLIKLTTFTESNIVKGWVLIKR